jgi:hypothetical protein
VLTQTDAHCVEETELKYTIALFREAPDEVLVKREAAWAAELTPNMMILGNPLRGRFSALDVNYRSSPH